MPANTEINTNAQDTYVNGNRYRLEVKTKRTGSDEGPISQPIHLVVDWGDVEGTPEITPIIFRNKYEFPSVGEADEKTVYIATDENRIYRWDAKAMMYLIIGADWHEINLIDCGGAK